MDEQMIADIAKAIDDALPQRVCLADESLTFVATAAHSVIAGKVAELEGALRFAHDTLVEQRVARIIRTDLRAGGLADMISAIVNKARAVLSRSGGSPA